MTEDDVFSEYEAVLQKIYDKRTAGDHTFLGVLAEFVRKLSEVELFEKMQTALGEKHYLQCECGEVFDEINTALAHEETCPEHDLTSYTIVEEDEAF